MQFTASTELCEKLRLAQDLLRHQVPDGDLGQVIDRALTALLRDLTRQKFAATDRPHETAMDRSHRSNERKGGGIVPNSRHIPAEVRRTVWSRDGGQCAFVAHTGRRCTARAFLEFHHVVPHSAGGEATVENIQLRCRGHNGYEAELYFSRRKHAGPDARGKKDDALNSVWTELAPGGSAA
ncbi:MAG TPA: HNH endonuclease, partial [bacterium]|nr:HNH endonuclease [bacterium]